MINENALKAYLNKDFRDIIQLDIRKLASGVQGVGFLIEMETSDGIKSYVVKTLLSEGLGHDYPSDRAAVFLLDLSEFSKKDYLEEGDIKKIKTMASYLAEIHSVKKESKTLYWRKLRDTIGHGECLMGVFDTYPDGTLSYDEMADIVKQSVDWIYKLKPKFKRLSQIHGDFHPGNIWFTPSDTETRGHGD